MSGLIAYGSLMSVAELERHGFRCAGACPVTVLGFRRSFSQEPSWRKGAGNRRGVLTVSPRRHASMNAILVSGVSKSAFAAFGHRERGYDPVRVPMRQVQPFGDVRTDLVDPEKLFIYVGKPHKLNRELEPNRAYLELCLNAARDWGEAFLEVFRKTTFVSGAPLSEYPESLP